MIVRMVGPLTGHEVKQVVGCVGDEDDEVVGRIEVGRVQQVVVQSGEAKCKKTWMCRLKGGSAERAIGMVVCKRSVM